MKLIPVLILLLAANMAIAQPDTGGRVTNTDTAATKAKAIKWYFPVSSLESRTEWQGGDSFLNNWYSGQLAALQEPVLYNATKIDEVYRFTWLRTFHNPMAIRIERSGEKYTLYWKVCDGAGGYDAGKLETDMQKTIDRTAWEDFMTLLKNTDFWQTSADENRTGSDGAEWIMEGKTADRYHVVHRWSPKKETPFYQCCNRLITLTDIKIKKGDKY